jgi:tetratricopeptide (TPR) repeat protein
MVAAWAGHTHTVQALLDAGAKVNARDENGLTPLMSAAGEGHTATVQALLDGAAEVDARGKDGGTALMLAAENGHTAIVELLKEAGAAALPRQALILDVPFVSWSQAARLDYDYKDKEIINPSWPASHGMILRYWQQDWFAEIFPELLKNWTGSGGAAKNLGELKWFIADGSPVLVFAGLTPFAHPIETSFLRLMGDKAPELLPERSRSCPRTLGRLASYQAISRLEARRAPGVGISESLYTAARVVIGYSDDRQVVVLHDPSFGPAWEVSYEDFDKMWQPMNRSYMVFRPPNHAGLLAGQFPSEPYRPRTPDERAAFHLIYGCALSSVGRLTEATELLGKGLAIEGVGTGYQHLLLLELATRYHDAAGVERAIAATQRAIELVPESFRAWDFLAHLYRASSDKKRRKKAGAADKRAKKLMSDKKALRRLSEALPRDFWIPYLAPIRGWGFD